MGSIKGEGDIGEVLDLTANQGAVEGHPGVGRLDRLRRDLCDGTAKSSKEFGGERAIVAIRNGFFGQTNTIKPVVFDVPISTGAVEGVTGNEAGLGHTEIRDCLIGLCLKVLASEAFKVCPLFGTVGSVKNEVAIPKSGGIDVTQKWKNEADPMAVCWCKNIAGQECWAWR